MKLLLSLCAFSAMLFTVPIKEVANTVGVRDNQLIGYGLVVGLNGSGDGTSSKFTLQSVSNLLQGMSIKVDPASIKSKSIAAIMVTAKLPAFAKSGDKLDITASSLGDVRSLQGGTLLFIALGGIDGEIYAIAQGSLSTGGLTARPGGAGPHSTAASVVDGANVGRKIPQNFNENTDLTLSLKTADLKIAHDIERVLNSIFDESVARAIDSRTVKLNKPEEFSAVEFMARVLEQDIAYTPQSKVITDERTGTAIAGADVEIEPVLITHKDITIKTDPNDQNAVAQNEVDMEDGGTVDPASSILRISNPKTTVASIAKMFNKLGATPNDVIAIMENLKRASAISADLEVI